MLRAMDATSLLGAMLGSGFGRGRGPSLGTVAAGAAGVAAVGGLGYLAYRHFQGQKDPQAPQPAQAGWGAAPGASAAPPGPGGIGGFLSGITGSTSSLRTDGFSVPGYEWQQSGGQPAVQPPPVAPFNPAPPTQPAAPGAAAQNDQALLLVRAMIAAAYADGLIDDVERVDIISRLDSAGVAPREREMFLRELASPKPVTALAADVKSPEMAEQFYVVSLLAMKIDSDAERAYARMLPSLLNLSAEQVAAIHQKANLPAVA